MAASLTSRYSYRYEQIRLRLNVLGINEGSLENFHTLEVHVTHNELRQIAFQKACGIFLLSEQMLEELVMRIMDSIRHGPVLSPVVSSHKVASKLRPHTALIPFRSRNLTPLA